MRHSQGRPRLQPRLELVPRYDAFVPELPQLTRDVHRRTIAGQEPIPQLRAPRPTDSSLRPTHPSPEVALPSGLERFCGRLGALPEALNACRNY